MNRNYPVSVGGSVLGKTSGKELGKKKAGNWMKVSFLVAAVLAAAGVMFYWGPPVHAAKVSGPGSSHAGSSQPISAAHKPLPLKSLSLPLVFEPNQGQTAPQVKYLAHGAGYGLFLTADETVLSLRRSAAKGQPSPSSVIRMRLDEANSTAQVSAAQPLPGKSSYFIGNDPSKWRRDIPQFGRVEYTSVYPGVDLVYYGHEGQLEYDFRVAPGADSSQIALSFNGASAHIDAGNSGDLILSTANGDVHFHAPHIYQPATDNAGNAEKTITGSFRQLADNKIGFNIGNYDRGRELVIDPTLSYSTYLGGSGTEGFVHVAVDSSLNIYLTGATNSTNFPVTNGSTLAGTQNLFISKINPQNAGTGNSQLVYSIYLGGSGVDTPAGIQVDSNFGIYVAGSTSSPDFPTTASNAFNPGPVTGNHGFLSKISAAQTPTNPPSLVYTLTYSTYLAGNGADNVTGIAIDATNQNAYVTGDTTSNNPVSNGFPANANGYQTSSNAAAGDPQFFASQINTSGSGPQSMLYSTYFGGGNPAGAIAVGGGIAVTPAATGVSMFFTGTTNMLPLVGANNQPAFPLLNAQQACLNEPPNSTCATATPTSITDAFVAQINPNNNGVSSLVYSTYLGGSGTDTGLAIAVDTFGSAYVVGSTNSNNWSCGVSACTPTGFQAAYAGVGGNTNGYIAKIGSQIGAVFPLSYFTYLGGSGPDSAQAIQVDGNQNAYVAGNTASPNLPVTTDALQAYGGGGDAFAALISTTLAPTAGPPPAPPAGDYVTYLGGSNLDQGTGIALDTYNAAYVAGNTLSANFPVTSTAYQPQLNAGSQDAFVSTIGSVSKLLVTAATTPPSPSPNPVAAGTQVAFTFSIVNNGPDNAANVNFYGTVPTPQLTGSPTAKLTSGTGNCAPVQGSVVPCFVPSLAVGGIATVEVDVTPSATVVPPPLTIAVSGAASANNGPLQSSVTQQVSVVDFTVQVGQPNPNSIYAGNPTQVQVQFCPTVPTKGYSGTITPSETTSPSMVTATTPSFNPTTVTLSGNGCGSTVLSIATVARPVNTGSLLHGSGSSFYATWLPIGGLSLMGLGVGATRRRRRWLIGALLGLVVGIIMLLPSCGSTSVSANPTGGTLAGNYNIIVTGSAGTGASHQGSTILTVN